jgi:hypothetical protein
MSGKECTAELDAAGVPKKGRSFGGRGLSIAEIRDLVRRLRAGEPAASLKVPRKPKSAEELFVLDKAEQLACRARIPRPFDFKLSRGDTLLVVGHARRGRREEGEL